MPASPGILPVQGSWSKLSKDAGLEASSFGFYPLLLTLCRIILQDSVSHICLACILAEKSGGFWGWESAVFCCWRDTRPEGLCTLSFFAQHWEERHSGSILSLKDEIRDFFFICLNIKGCTEINLILLSLAFFQGSTNRETLQENCSQKQRCYQQS